MTYLQTHRRPDQRLRHLAAIVIGGIAVLAVLIQLISPRFFSGLFTAIARPFWRTEFDIQNGELLSAETLLNEKAALTRLVDEMHIRLEATGALEAENAELKLLLGRGSAATESGTSTAVDKGGQKNHSVGILAAVLRRPPVSGYDQMIIDIGKDYGISTSSLVYVQGNVLIGHVIEVFRSTAKVRLLTSPGENTPVLIGPQHNAGIAIGRGGGQYEVQVSRDASITEGDFMLGNSFDDRPLGRVSSVLLDPTQPFKMVLVAPPVNVYQIRWVLVKNND